MKNISFVVQGPVNKQSNKEDGVYSTAQVLASIRKWYPQAEIILSTWKDADVAGLTYDQLVLSDDPGGFLHNGVMINNNRLILSAKAGILKASNPYVVKTRTDILITNNSLQSTLKYITPIHSPYGVFTHFILSTIYYVRNPLKLNLVFHPSDIFLVGLKEDLLCLFDIPVASRDFFVNEDNSTKTTIEQHFFVSAIFKKKKMDYQVPKWGYTNRQYFAQSERFLFNNYLFFDIKDLGVEFPKRLYTAFMPNANYTLPGAKLLSAGYRTAPPLSFLLNKLRTLQYVVRYYVPRYIRQWRDKISALALTSFKINKSWEH